MESVLKIMKFIYHKNIKLKIYLKTLAPREDENETIPGRVNGLPGPERCLPTKYCFLVRI
jgi:hypothetical protein